MAEKSKSTLLDSKSSKENGNKLASFITHAAFRPEWLELSRVMEEQINKEVG